MKFQTQVAMLFSIVTCATAMAFGIRDPVEQLLIEFFVDVVHQTTGNFSALCTGDKGSTCHQAINGVENNIKCLVRIYPMLETANIADVQDLSFIMEYGNKSDMVLNILQPSHNVVRNDAMDQEGKGTNGVEPHDLRPIIFELPLLYPEEVNNGVLEKVFAVRNKQVAIDGEMKFEPNPVDVLDGHDCVVGESSTCISSSSGFDESSYLSWVENFEVSQENYGEATRNKNSLTQFRRAAIPGRIIMISKPSSTFLL